MKNDIQVKSCLKEGTGGGGEGGRSLREYGMGGVGEVGEERVESGNTKVEGETPCPPPKH